MIGDNMLDKKIVLVLIFIVAILSISAVNASENRDNSTDVVVNNESIADSMPIFNESNAVSNGSAQTEVTKSNLTEPKSISLSVSKLSTTYGSGKYFKVKVIDSKAKKPVANVKLILKVYSGKKYKKITAATDSNGIAKYYASNLGIGNHKVTINVKDSKKFSSKMKYSSIKISMAKLKISAPKITGYYNESKRYKIAVKNSESKKPMKSIKVMIKVFTDKKYKNWSNLINYYPKNKAIVEVIPYYNYYDRELNTTKWSYYYGDEELSDEVSKYGIKLPLDEGKIPAIPKEAIETNIESDNAYYYRYRDRMWKWYDIEGNYSNFSSERPEGFAEKDEDSEKYTEWSEYSLDYPQEKSYREIQQTTGYKFYYENKKGKKIYYNSGKYTAREEVNTEKYNKYDEGSAELYRFRDKQWRWYNGEQRSYSGYLSEPHDYAPIKDKDTEILESPTNWSAERYTDETTVDYRIEEKKLMTRFRRQYEILSLPVLKKPLTKEKFEQKVKTNLKDFSSREDKKLEVSYKFRYKKS